MRDAKATRLVPSALLAAAVVAMLGGCGPFRLPELPARMETPAAEVTAVQLTEAGPDASRYELLLTFRNENPYPLPMTGASYTLRTPVGSYTGDTPPNATIPAGRSIRIRLPAVIPGEADEETDYRASGSVELLPPGQIRGLLYDLGFPQPRARFRDGGTTGQ